MKSQIKLIAAISYIDKKLEELKEEYGDLPDQIDKKNEQLTRAKELYEETEQILTELREFVKTAKVTLVEIKDKEVELSKKQFQVKNNKEFDAITNEIKHLKDEHEELSIKMRKEGIKEENLINILEDQKEKYQSLLKEHQELVDEEKSLSEEQSEDKVYLVKKRGEIESQISKNFLDEYNRIRASYPDPAVQILRGSCKGFKIPSQMLVEIRNNPDKIFIEEHSGRILIPEDIYIDEDILNELVSN